MPALTRLVPNVVEQREGLGIEWDHALGAEFADGDAQPGAVITEVDDAVELEVQQLTDAHPVRSQKADLDSGEAVVESLDSGHRGPVDVGW